MLDSYEALAANIPSDIKNDYQRYLTNNLKQIKDIFEIRLNQSARKIKDETNINGFDKLIDAPLNKLKVDEIIEKYQT